MSHTGIYPIADQRQMALHTRRRRIGILAYVIAQMAGLTPHELAGIESGRKQATSEQVATLDTILSIYERAQERASARIQQAQARSLVSTNA